MPFESGSPSLITEPSARTRSGGMELATSIDLPPVALVLPSSLPSSPPIWTFLAPRATSTQAPTITTSAGMGPTKYLSSSAHAFLHFDGGAGGGGWIDGGVTSMIRGVG